MVNTQMSLEIYVVKLQKCVKMSSEYLTCSKTEILNSLKGFSLVTVVKTFVIICFRCN